ncbi:MAG: type IX secretion system membrane protein PorP/SprF [Bacteroidota bacterium]
MKKILIFVVSTTVFTAFGQQLGINSQYMFNKATINPAYAGSEDYIPIHFNFRKQWAGFTGAPTAQTLTTHADMGKNLGFGGTIYNDLSGPTRLTGVNLMLNYRLRLSKDNLHSLRVGMGVTLAQHFIDVTKLTTDVQNDPAMANGFNNQFVPDVDLGVYYAYGKKGFAGISVKNGIQVKRDLFNDFSNTFENWMCRQYNLLGGYNFQVANDWQIRTSTVLRMIEARPFTFDLTVLGQYKDYVWFGAGYRLKDAVSIMAGGQYKMVKIGYSYDVTTSKLRNSSSGSHEIFLELQINRKGKQASSANSPYLKRNRIYTPASK